MIDVLTNKPIQVDAGHYFEGPTMLLAVDQIPEVRRVLEEKGYKVRVKETRVSINNGPLFTRVFLPIGTDEKAIQAVLDQLA